MNAILYALNRFREDRQIDSEPRVRHVYAGTASRKVVAANRRRNKAARAARRVHRKASR